jgi:hypothetical protein
VKSSLSMMRWPSPLVAAGRRQPPTLELRPPGVAGRLRCLAGAQPIDEALGGVAGETAA